MKFALAVLHYGASVVASLAEAWIEIMSNVAVTSMYSVASLAEAWIEIVKKVLQKSVARGRLPRGGVD